MNIEINSGRRLGRRRAAAACGHCTEHKGLNMPDTMITAHTTTSMIDAIMERRKFCWLPSNEQDSALYRIWLNWQVCPL